MGEGCLVWTVGFDRCGNRSLEWARIVRYSVVGVRGGGKGGGQLL